MAISIYREGKQFELTNKEIANIASYYHDEDVYEAVVEELTENLYDYLCKHYAEHEGHNDIDDIIYDVIVDRINNNEEIVDDYLRQNDNNTFFEKLCKDEKYYICEEIEAVY